MPAVVDRVCRVAQLAVEYRRGFAEGSGVPVEQWTTIVDPDTMLEDEEHAAVIRNMLDRYEDYAFRWYPAVEDDDDATCDEPVDSSITGSDLVLQFRHVVRDDAAAVNDLVTNESVCSIM